MHSPPMDGKERAGATSAGPLQRLRVESISKAFGVVQALEDVSFSVEEGTIHAVVGQNGAGKSTLMQILSGAQAPDAGEVVLGDGSPVALVSPTRAKPGIRTVYQELNLVPYQTIAENIFLGIEPRGRLGLIDRRAMRRRSRAGCSIASAGARRASARSST